MTATARSTARRSVANRRTDREPWWFLLDPFLVLSALAIAAIGAVLVYSATRGPVGDFVAADRTQLWRQIIYIVVGVVVAVVAALFEPVHLRRGWPLAFGVMMVALAAVLVVGVEINGTRGWFSLGSFNLQPSEPGKVVVIVGLALVLGARAPVVTWWRLLLALAITAAPIMLLLGQPDLGTILVYLVVVVAVVVASGVRVSWIAALALIAVLGTFGLLRSDTLAEYQQARLVVFFSDPDELSEQAAEYAYNVEQAQIAIGNGGLGGQGLFQGTQTRSELVPYQETDFIFTVAGEELGFQGSAVLLGLYALLLFRVWRSAQIASSNFDRLLCVGVFAMFLFQMFQGVGMTIGMMPVTGIPFPLVSYGGSSMLTSMCALGLVAGVYRRRLTIESTTPV